MHLKYDVKLFSGKSAFILHMLQIVLIRYGLYLSVKLYTQSVLPTNINYSLLLNPNSKKGHFFLFDNSYWNK